MLSASFSTGDPFAVFGTGVPVFVQPENQVHTTPEQPPREKVLPPIVRKAPALHPAFVPSLFALNNSDIKFDGEGAALARPPTFNGVTHSNWIEKLDADREVHHDRIDALYAMVMKDRNEAAARIAKLEARVDNHVKHVADLDDNVTSLELSDITTHKAITAMETELTSLDIAVNAMELSDITTHKAITAFKDAMETELTAVDIAMNAMRADVSALEAHMEPSEVVHTPFSVRAVEVLIDNIHKKLASKAPRKTQTQRLVEESKALGALDNSEGYNLRH